MNQASGSQSVRADPSSNTDLLVPICQQSVLLTMMMLGLSVAMLLGSAHAQEIFKGENMNGE
eukprot:COSAG03_NODE_2470_length_2724_cov_2.685714_2_plen_62_part_00